MTMMTSQPLLHSRRLLQPHASRCCQGPSSLSRILDRSFVVKTRCMLWAAHCVAVAALSALEIRAIEVGERRQQRRLHSSSSDDHVEPATLSSLSSPPSAGDGSAIGRVHLKRQMLAHLIDLPLAARSAGIQVTLPCAENEPFGGLLLPLSVCSCSSGSNCYTFSLIFCSRLCRCWTTKAAAYWESCPACCCGPYRPRDHLRYSARSECQCHQRARSVCSPAPSVPVLRPAVDRLLLLHMQLFNPPIRRLNRLPPAPRLRLICCVCRIAIMGSHFFTHLHRLYPSNLHLTAQKSNSNVVA